MPRHPPDVCDFSLVGCAGQLAHSLFVIILISVALTVQTSCTRETSPSGQMPAAQSGSESLSRAGGNVLAKDDAPPPGDAASRGAALFEFGEKALDRSDLARAVEAFRQARRVLEKSPGKERERAACCGNIGVALWSMERPVEAMIEYERALALFKSVAGSQREQAHTLVNIGNALDDLGKHPEALARKRQAFALLKDIAGAELEQAQCLNQIACGLLQSGEYEAALRQEQAALRLLEHSDSMGRERALCYMNIGIAFVQLGHFEKSIEVERMALSLLAPVRGTGQNQAKCHMNIGAALQGLGRYEEAIVEQEGCLALLESIPGTTRDRGGCYGNIGHLLMDMGLDEQSISRQEQALKLFETIPGTEREQAGAFLKTAIALGQMGKHREAIAKLRQALKFYQAVAGTERDQAACEQNIGVTLIQLGEYEEALSAIKAALARYGAIPGTERSRGRCYGAIGDAHLRVGRSAEAIAAYKQARQYGRGWWISLGLGNAHRARGAPDDLQKALTYLWEATILAEGSRLSVTAAEYRMAVFEKPHGVYSEIVDLLVKSQETTSLELPPVALLWEPAVTSAGGLLELTFHFTDRGKGRGLTDALRERSSLCATPAKADLLAKDRELSLRISKATTLREQLPANQDAQLATIGRRIDELQQQRNLVEAELKRTALGRYVAPRFRKPTEVARELPVTSALLQYSTGDKNKWLLTLTRDGVRAYPVGLPAAALPESSLHQETGLEQLAGLWKERPDRVGLDGLVRLARARAEDLGGGAAKRQSLIAAEDERAILDRLGDALLPQAALAELRQRGIKHLVVIPDGTLHYVPFAMLRVRPNDAEEKRYLIEEFAISYVPAVTTLEAIRAQKQEREKARKEPRRALLAFANPNYGTEPAPADDDMLTRLRSFRRDIYISGGLRLTSLPDTEQEAMCVASLFAPPERRTEPTKAFPDGAAVVCTSRGACEDQVKRWLGGSASQPQFRYLLFSMHGLADSRNGMLSCLALSAPGVQSVEDGFLQAQEILDLRLDTDLVMLSACQTGLGRLRGGEGLVGLSTAFFVAGAESVCASMWRVPSGPTSQLVTEFFKHLKEDRVDKAEALRQAQLTVMRQGRSPSGKPADYSAPFCWAAFVLNGEWQRASDVANSSP